MLQFFSISLHTEWFLMLPGLVFEVAITKIHKLNCLKQ